MIVGARRAVPMQRLVENESLDWLGLGQGAPCPYGENRIRKKIMEITFYISGALTVLFVVLMLVQNNPVSSAIYLVLSFFSLAAVYVTLDAHFIAALQILVYAGAIMVLFVFVIMLLNLKPSELSFDQVKPKSLSVGVLSLVFLGLMVNLIRKIPNVTELQFTPVNSAFGTAKAVGALMLNDYVVAFEVMGVLLTVGLIGAVLLGRSEN